MVGQGRPQSNPNTDATTHITNNWHRGPAKIVGVLRPVLICILAVVISCAYSTPLCFAQTELDSPAASLRFRVTWGGGQNQSWQGSISTESATVSKIAPLGLNQSSASTATLADPKNIRVQQTIPGNYDGFDFTFTGDPDSSIRIILSANDGPESRLEEIVTARSLLEGTFNRQLDDLGNRLAIDRAPGDVIAVQLQQDHLVIPSGSTFPISVALNHSEFKKCQSNMRVSIVPARKVGPVLWSKSVSLETNPTGSSTTSPSFDIQAPPSEGVYDLLIEVEKNWLGIKTANDNPAIRALTLPNQVLTRRVQFVSLSDQGSSDIAANGPADDGFGVIAEITPQSITQQKPNWRMVSQKQNPPLLGNNKSQLIPAGSVSRIELGTGGWQAIRLPTLQSGRPHIVEIEYPNDQPTSLGINVLDPSDQGLVSLQGADSGIEIPNSLAVGSSETTRGKTGVHRITYWPHSSNVYLLLANQSPQSTAQFGTIRVLAGPKKLPNANSHLATPSQGRKRMAWYESPSFMDDLGVQKFYDAEVGQPLDDWVAFYEGTSRLISYLQANHYQGAVMTVTADGSSIYPTAASGNTPTHDTGIFLSAGQDPIRKDVMRMMLKMFEREGLTLVPAFAFSHRLPDIESLRDPNQAPQSFDPVDESNAVALPSEKMAIYNPLDQAVQNSVVQTLQHFVDRYRGYQSLGGITLICKPDTYTLLNGTKIGHNPEMVKRFSDAIAQQPHSTNETIGQNQTQSQWIQWRADQMTRLYQTIADLVEQNIPEGHLFIAPSGIYFADEAYSAMCPNLHAEANFEQLMKRYGFDRSKLLSDPRIVLLNPQSLATAETVSASRIEINAIQSREVSAFFAGGMQPGTLFQHRGLWAHFAQLQTMSPFNAQTGRLMRRLQLTPAGHWNRQRFISAMRQQDSFYLFDGGRGLAQGQEQALENFAITFARLPQVRFSDVPFVQAEQPIEVTSVTESVIVRQAQFEGDQYVYAVNDSPWATTVTIKIAQTDTTARTADTAARVEYFPLGETNQGQQFAEANRTLTIELPPHGIAGGMFKGSQNAPTRYYYVMNEDVRPLLRKKTYSLQAKLNLAKNSPPLKVLANPDFESDIGDGRAGWDVGDQSSIQAAVDQGQGFQSNSSLKLVSGGNPAWIRSNRFSIPKTGRLSVIAYLRVEDPATQPALRIAVEGEAQTSTYYRFGAVGSLAPETAAKQIGKQWRRFVVHFDDLPTGEIRDLRIGFDLMGKGVVWIDNVSVNDRWFDENDSMAITQLLAGAAPLLDQPSSFESSRRILESYWPRFLDEYIGVDPAASTPANQIADGDDVQPEGTGNPDDDNIFRRVKSSSPSLLRRWRSNLPQR